MARRRSMSWSAAAAPTWCAGMGALARPATRIDLPYRFFGFDSAISEVVNYAKRIDDWMRARRTGRTSLPIWVPGQAPFNCGNEGRAHVTKKGIEGFPILSRRRTRWPRWQRRDDRVCVLNILGGESRRSRR